MVKASVQLSPVVVSAELRDTKYTRRRNTDTEWLYLSHLDMASVSLDSQIGLYCFGSAAQIGASFRLGGGAPCDDAGEARALRQHQTVESVSLCFRQSLLYRVAR
jgi:hypothetical protein